MIQLTQKGKEIYGFKGYSVYTRWGLNTIEFCCENMTIAFNPLELKALLDMGLIEIK